MNKPFSVLGSITFGVCTSFAQNAPTPPRSALASPPVNAATTRHGRVEGIMATPSGTIGGLFLGGHTAVTLSPELSRQMSASSLRGREVTVSGPSQTVAGSVTVEARTLRVGGHTFLASPEPQVGLAPPPLGRAGDGRELAGLGGRPGLAPGAPPPPPPPAPGSRVPPRPPTGGVAPPPPPPPMPGTNGSAPRATPPPAPLPSGSPAAGVAPPPPLDQGGLSQNAAPLPSRPPSASGVGDASPEPPPPPAAGSQPTTTTPPPPTPPQQ